jgi:hypothetical protein
VSSRMKVTALFDDIANSMLQFFEGWDTYVPHQAEKGGIRERRVRDFLRAYLPQKYGVGTGHIIDRKGNVSLQEDIVIFDQTDSPVLEIDPYYQVFPCETVYATVEVKSFLDGSEIGKCVDHTERLREMYRADLGPVESFVFAYDSYASSSKPAPVWAREKFMEKASGETEQRPMPSVVLCLKRKFILNLDDEGKYITDALDSGILLYFFDEILSRLLRVGTSLPSLFFDYGWEKENPVKRFR